MSDEATAWTIRVVKAAALREAAEALEDIDPDDIREWLITRAEKLENK